MRRLRFIRFAKNERGSTLAELAILVPFLIVMAAAVAELGRVFQTFSTLSKSTRSAARYLSGKPYDEKHIAFTKQMALCGKTNCAGTDPLVSGLKVDHIEVTPEFKDPGGGGGNPVRVTVSIKDYNFQPLFNLAALLNATRFATFPVRPSTTMYYMLDNPAGATE